MTTRAYIRRIVSLAHVLPFLSCVAAPEGSLLLLGETPLGWQVFHHDIGANTTEQLTNSIGDKRSLRFEAETGWVYFRDATGDIVVWANGAERRWRDDFAGCSSFDRDPSSGKIYFTRLATDNPQRQFVWEQSDGARDCLLLFRPELGSIRQVKLSVAGNLLAGTHVSRIGEERIFVLDLESRVFQPVSPKMTVGAYPSWDRAGSKLFYSKEVADGNYDLYTIDVTSRRETAVLQTSDASELAPSPDRSGRVYYERRAERGSTIGILDTADGQVSQLLLPMAAREPLWIPLKGLLKNQTQP